jgi:hypothetical protein
MRVVQVDDRPDATSLMHPRCYVVFLGTGWIIAGLCEDDSCVDAQQVFYLLWLIRLQRHNET